MNEADQGASGKIRSPVRPEFGDQEPYASDRFSRLVIGGAHPYPNALVVWRELLDIGICDGSTAFVAAFEQMIGTIPTSWRRRLQNADLRALRAAVDEDRVNHEAVLACLYAGDADPRFADTKTAAGVIRGATFFSLADLNHLEGFVRTDLVLSEVDKSFRG
jgi:hypothetical protein